MYTSMSGLFQCRAVKTGLLEGFQVGLKRVLAQGGGKRSQLNKKRKESTELFEKMIFFYFIHEQGQSYVCFTLCFQAIIIQKQKAKKCI